MDIFRAHLFRAGERDNLGSGCNSDEQCAAIVDVNRVFIPRDNEGRVQESTPRSL